MSPTRAPRTATSAARHRLEHKSRSSKDMNWFGNQKGYECHLLALALAIPLIIRGAGAFSVDRALSTQAGGTA